MSLSRHYQTLIVAGLGSIGSSMFAVGGPYLDSFARVVAVDQNPGKRLPEGAAAVERLTGDITDQAFLQGLLARVPGPVLLVNLCAGIDNVRLRQTLAGLPVAYLDSCCCTPEGTDEVRFSRMMPYTLTPVESSCPHWVCWGINPGVVELVARLLCIRMGLDAAGAGVTIFEHDGLAVQHDAERPAVGWCPAFLVEEMLISPALVVDKGELREGAGPGGVPALAMWGDVAVPSRVVGHEDIWNLGCLLGVAGARFVYGLSPQVMAVLAHGDAAAAAAMLHVPPAATVVRGLERIAVQVRALATGASRTLLWATDHGEVWERFGVNAVQFQTCLSLWLAVHMLQHTRFGTLPGTWCASNLPLAPADWRGVEAAMTGMGMTWEAAEHLDLRLELEEAPERPAQAPRNPAQAPRNPVGSREEAAVG